MNWFRKLKNKYFFEMSLPCFGLFYSLLTILLYNRIFFEKVYERYPSSVFVFFTFIVFFLLMNAVCALLFWRYTAKPLAIFFVMANAFVYYFMKVYNVAFDKVMLMNVMETDAGEVKALLSVSMLFFVLLTGVLPAYLICKVRIDYVPFRREILKKILILLGTLLLSAGIVGIGYKETAQFARNNKAVKYYWVPVNYVGATVSLVKKLKDMRPRELVKIGDDAVLKPYWKNNGKKNLFVFVAGETARAKNFSLNGYDRPTNEPLEPYEKELLSFGNVRSCGTSTAISLPCMFALEGRKKFDKSEAAYTENLLDVLQKAGYAVNWRGNVTGCKGICSRVASEMLCDKETCFDGILNKGLEEKLRQNPRDSFVVLHQLGSHGPTYYKRYPESAARFAPVCNTERLDKCSQEEIVNVYDNTIYYTSQNLAETIEILKDLGDIYNTFLLYVSDHGESLGENNIYLHAAPYALAPDEQTRVPLVMWFSDDFARTFKLDKACLRRKAGGEFSHDNLFHSFLGLTGVMSAVYKPELDLFAGCRIEN